MFEKMIAHLPIETPNIEAEVEVKAQIKKLKSWLKKRRSFLRKLKKLMKTLIKR